MSDFPAIQPPKPDEEQPGFRMRPEGYQLSEELAEVVNEVIAAHSRLGYLEHHSLAAILDHGEPPEDMTTDGVAKAKRITGWQRALTTHDAAVIVNAAVWGALSERQREALVLHHLLHFDSNPKTGELVIVGHDVEEFHYVAATYGQWQPSLRNFAEQLQLGLERGRD